MADREDSSSQVGASILGLSQSLGLFEICRRIDGQQKARLSSFERKQFTRQTREPPFGETVRQHTKAATGAS